MEISLETTASLRSTISIVGSQPTDAGGDGDFLATLQWFQHHLAASVTSFPAEPQPIVVDSFPTTGADISDEMAEDSDADTADCDTDMADMGVYLTAVSLGLAPFKAETPDQATQALTGADEAMSRFPALSAPSTEQSVFSTDVSGMRQRAPTGVLFGEKALQTETAASMSERPSEKASAEVLPMEMADMPQPISDRPVEHTPTMANADSLQGNRTTLQKGAGPVYANELPKQDAPPTSAAPTQPAQQPSHPVISSEPAPTTEQAVFSIPSRQRHQLEFEGVFDQPADVQDNPIWTGEVATPSNHPEAATQSKNPSTDRPTNVQAETTGLLDGGKVIDGQNHVTPTVPTVPAAPAAPTVPVGLTDNQFTPVAQSDGQFIPVAQTDDQSELSVMFDRHQPQHVLKSLQQEDKLAGRESVWATAAVPKPASQILLETGPPPSVAEPVPIQIAEHVKIMVKEGKQTFHVKLHPEGCGELTLQLEMTEGALSVDIRTSLSSTKVMIEEQLGELRQALVSNNIPVSDIQVSCDNSQSGPLPRFDMFGDSTSGGAREHQHPGQQLSQRQTHGAREVRQQMDGAHLYLREFQWGRFSRKI